MKKLTGETIRKLPRRHKIVIAAVAAVVALAVLCAGVAAYAASTVQKNVIGADAALSIALQDAGVEESQASVGGVDLRLRQGVLLYDVAFASGQIDYTYEVKASDGTILNRFAEADGEAADPGTTAPAVSETEPSSAESGQTSAASETPQTTSPKGGSGVTLAEAKSIALRHAGLSSGDVRFTKAKADYDDGVKEYDIEFVSGSYEYEFEIRASDGQILSYDRDRSETHSTTSSSTAAAKYIGVDKAKSIALNDSGVSASNASFVKAKLEEDDGFFLYEIEFISGRMEYEYEIDAKTGKILDRSAEYDD